MPLNIRNEAVNELAEELAARRKLSKTEAVRQALSETLKRDNDSTPFMERIKVIQERVAARGKSGLEADKAFYDSLNDE
jgi:antitoxin VapB